MSDKSTYHSLQTALVKADEAGYKRGYTEGLNNTRKVVLDYLEEQYMAPDAPARKSPAAEAILQMARELSELLR